MKPDALKSLSAARASGVLTEEAQRLMALLSLDAAAYDDAIILWRDLAATGRATADDYNNLGTAYSRKEDNENAVIAYQKVLALNPKHTTALRNVALAQMYLEDFEGGALSWKKYVSIKADDAAAWYNYGVCQENMSDYGLALNSYKKAKDLGYSDTAAVDKAISNLQGQNVTTNND